MTFRTLFLVVAIMAMLCVAGCTQLPESGNECYKEHYQNIRAEPVSVLEQIQEKQQVHYKANCTYLTCETPEDFQTLGVQFPDSCKYVYSVRWAGIGGFVAFAHCNLDSDTTDFDAWSIHEYGEVHFLFDDISKWRKPFPPIPDVIIPGSFPILDTRTEETIQITLPGGKYCYTWIGSDAATQAIERGLVCKLVSVTGGAFYYEINKLAHEDCPRIQIDGVDVKDFIDKIATEDECESFLGKLE